MHQQHDKSEHLVSWHGETQRFILIFKLPLQKKSLLAELTHRTVSNIIFFSSSFVLLSALIFVIREIVIFILLSVLDGLCKRNNLQRCAKQALFIVLFHACFCFSYLPMTAKRRHLGTGVSDRLCFIFFYNAKYVYSCVRP